MARDGTFLKSVQNAEAWKNVKGDGVNRYSWSNHYFQAPLRVSCALPGIPLAVSVEDGEILRTPFDCIGFRKFDKVSGAETFPRITRSAPKKAVRTIALFGAEESTE
jgi:hypothetical protein